MRQSELFLPFVDVKALIDFLYTICPLFPCFTPHCLNILIIRSLTDRSHESIDVYQLLCLIIFDLKLSDPLYSPV